MSTMADDLPTRLAFLEALRRAEAIAEAFARGACQSAVSGRQADLEAPQRALDAFKRAKEFRQQVEQELANPKAA